MKRSFEIDSEEGWAPTHLKLGGTAVPAKSKRTSFLRPWYGPGSGGGRAALRGPAEVAGRELEVSGRDMGVGEAGEAGEVEGRCGEPPCSPRRSANAAALVAAGKEGWAEGDLVEVG